MWFLGRFRIHLIKKHIPLGNFALEGGFLKSTFSNHSNLTFQRADFQKECGFWVDLGFISSKNTFLLGILLLKVVFSNHHSQTSFFKEQISKRNVVFEKINAESPQKQSLFPKETSINHRLLNRNFLTLHFCV